MRIANAPLRARPRSRRLPPSHWKHVWAAWCPTCEQDTMPMPTGCCGWCDTDLTGQPTREWFEPPLRGPAEKSIHYSIAA